MGSKGGGERRGVDPPVSCPRKDGVGVASLPCFCSLASSVALSSTVFMLWSAPFFSSLSMSLPASLLQNQSPEARAYARVVAESGATVAGFTQETQGIIDTNNNHHPTTRNRNEDREEDHSHKSHRKKKHGRSSRRAKRISREDSVGIDESQGHRRRRHRRTRSSRKTKTSSELSEEGNNGNSVAKQDEEVEGLKRENMQLREQLQKAMNLMRQFQSELNGIRRSKRVMFSVNTGVNRTGEDGNVTASCDSGEGSMDGGHMGNMQDPSKQNRPRRKKSQRKLSTLGGGSDSTLEDGVPVIQYIPTSMQTLEQIEQSQREMNNIREKILRRVAAGKVCRGQKGFEEEAKRSQRMSLDNVKQPGMSDRARFGLSKMDLLRQKNKILREEALSGVSFDQKDGKRVGAPREETKDEQLYEEDVFEAADGDRKLGKSEFQSVYERASASGGRFTENRGNDLASNIYYESGPTLADNVGDDDERHRQQQQHEHRHRMSCAVEASKGPVWGGSTSDYT